jgi:dTDP-4-amino-4,6-dideoxygalactose transaminase
MKILFNKPFIINDEITYIRKALEIGQLSGNGLFTKKCHSFFQDKYGFKKCLLTSSCTDALEMTAILLDIKPGDEVIMPSYTFVSTANAFVLRGATIVFCDSHINHPGIDETKIESLITEKTKAIVVVHYAGFACEMNTIMDLANKYNLFVVEDAAQAIDNYYIDPLTNEKKALGGIGHLAAFSFHETKNIIAGEGGMLVINDDQFVKRAEIIWEKGTNRTAFFRGEVDKYGWVDIGSSFLPSEITAAFLYAQLEHIELIQDKRISLWNAYQKYLTILTKYGVSLTTIPNYSKNNAHNYYIVCRNVNERSELITFLRLNQINAVFHYLSLHKSSFYESKVNSISNLPNSDKFSECLLRLPMYYELTLNDIDKVCQKIIEYYVSKAI